MNRIDETFAAVRGSFTMALALLFAPGAAHAALPIVSTGTSTAAQSLASKLVLEVPGLSFSSTNPDVEISVANTGKGLWVRLDDIGRGNRTLDRFISFTQGLEPARRIAVLLLSDEISAWTPLRPTVTATVTPPRLPNPPEATIEGQLEVALVVTNWTTPIRPQVGFEVGMFLGGPRLRLGLLLLTTGHLCCTIENEDIRVERSDLGAGLQGSVIVGRPAGLEFRLTGSAFGVSSSVSGRATGGFIGMGPRETDRRFAVVARVGVGLGGAANEKTPVGWRIGAGLRLSAPAGRVELPAPLASDNALSEGNLGGFLRVSLNFKVF